MKEINETFAVRSLYPCEHIIKYESMNEHDPAWRQTVLGCVVLYFLKEMFHFKITYPNDNFFNMTKGAKREALYPRSNDSVDIYVKPMELQTETWDNAYPINAIFVWRFGFVLRRPRGIHQEFYSQPFTKTVWLSICGMILLSSLVFYLLSWWEHRLFNAECNFFHELLLASAALCQHILPMSASTHSRRIAYVSFLICVYIIHCFYTSNLLSYFMSDKDEPMSLQSIVNYNYQVILLRDMNLITNRRKYEMSLDKNLRVVWHKVQELHTMNIRDALKAVIFTKSALLSDYITLYPIWKRYFEITEICELVEIDLYTNVKNYFFTSKNFSYKEEFKIGILRAKEVGLLARVIVLDKYSPISCEQAKSHYTVQFEHTLVPVGILLIAYGIALIVLIGEKIHHYRNRVWPYVN